VRRDGLGKLKKVYSRHRVSYSRPSGLYDSALTTMLLRASIRNYEIPVCETERKVGHVCLEYSE
jgi:hypothetical protein